MTSQEISKLIDEVWNGVENSKAGRIIEIKEDKETLHHVPFQTFVTLLSSLCPKGQVTVEASGGMELKEPKEKWE